MEDIHNQPWDNDASWMADVNQKFAQRSEPHFCGTGSTSTRLLAVESVDGVWAASSKLRLNDVPRDLILFIIIKRSKFHWMQPCDADVDDVVKLAGSPLKSSNGIEVGDVLWVCFADGTFWALATPVPQQSLRPFLTVGQVKQVRREDLLGPFRLFETRYTDRGK